MNNINNRMRQYARFVDQGVTLKIDTVRERLMLAGLGIGGEAGEVVDEIKKISFHAKDYDNCDLIFELGDLLWYMQLLMNTTGISWDDVIEGNIKKLTERYPDRHPDV